MSFPESQESKWSLPWSRWLLRKEIILLSPFHSRFFFLFFLNFLTNYKILELKLTNAVLGCFGISFTNTNSLISSPQGSAGTRPWIHYFKTQHSILKTARQALSVGSCDLKSASMAPGDLPFLYEAQELKNMFLINIVFSWMFSLWWMKEMDFNENELILMKIKYTFLSP